MRLSHMSLTAIMLVLLAAILHASWNAMLKSGADRLRTMVIMNVTCAVVAGAIIPFVPAPDSESWVFLASSGVLHVGYSLFLVRAYRHGELGQVYPIARGSSPLMITLGAAIAVGENPSALALAGIVLVSSGILSLARGWSKIASVSDIHIALATGFFIACYTLADGIGARLSHHSGSYTVWLFLIDGIPMAIIYWLKTGWTKDPLFDRSATTAKAALGGMVSFLAYGLVIWAASIGPLGPVSARRETSVVFAAIIGRLFLSEHLSTKRMIACLSVAAGALVLGFASGV
jgi:uncharacterized membrane protein